MNATYNAVVVLTMIIPCIILAGYFLKKIFANKIHSNESIKIVNQLAIGSKERIVLLTVNEEMLLIGVTPHSISTLKIYPNDKQPNASTHSHVAQKHLLR